MRHFVPFFVALPGHDDVLVTGIGYTPEGEFTHEDETPLDPYTDPLVGRFLKTMALATNAYLEEDEQQHMQVVGDTGQLGLIYAYQE